jgi:hypothetical protein
MTQYTRNSLSGECPSLVGKGLFGIGRSSGKGGAAVGIVWAFALLQMLAVLRSTALGDSPSYRQVILVQNSGWMEPFFTDPRSQLRPLVAALADQLARNGGLVTVASFNQEGQIPERTSPHVLYEGAFTEGTVGRVLGNLDLPRRPDGHFADADFHGALQGAISKLLKGQPGVIWMVTNNKNAPDNDPQVEQNTKSFFRLLKDSESITRLVAFPVRMPVTGQAYSENGLLIYGIGYGKAGGEMLSKLVEQINGARLFTDPAVVLKPLQDFPLYFLPRGTEPKNLKAEWRGGALIVEGLKGEEAQEVVISGQLNSEFYPHVIARAELKASWIPYSGRSENAPPVEVAVVPSELRELRPHTDGNAVTLRLRIPRIARQGGVAGLTQDRVDLVGFLKLNLENVTLQFTKEFSDKMEALYGLNQLPPLFFDNRQVTSATATIPIRLSVHHSLQPLLLLIGVTALLGLSSGVLFFLIRTPRTVTVHVGSAVRKVTLRPFQKTELRDPATGSRLEVSVGIFGRPSVRVLDGDKH